MADGTSGLAVLNTALLAGVLLTTTMVTCSNDRLETRVIGMEDQTKRDTGTANLAAEISALSEEISTLRQAVRSRPPAAAPADGGQPDAPQPDQLPASMRIPGDPSRVLATGWGGRQAKVLYVEGAVPNAPLRPDAKPHPQGGAYVSRRISAPSSLNYYATNEGETSTVTGYLLGRLIALDIDTMEDRPGLATSWELSDDRLTYTYHLRKGVQFADGRPFTSADVKFSFDVMRDKAVDANHLRSAFEDVEELSAPDPHTVVVRYRTEYWKGVYTVGYQLRVLNKGWYEEQIPVHAKGSEIDRFAVEPGKPGFGEVFNKIRIPCPGTGPYYFEKGATFDKDGLQVLQNPFHWEMQVHPERHNLSQLRWRYIADAVAAFEEFRKERFDITVVDTDRWEDDLRHDESLTSKVNVYEYYLWKNHASYIAWNCRRPPFSDPRVRRAMTHLVNRQWILDELERGTGKIAVCNARLGSPDYSTDLAPHPFDPEKARALLAEAGWRDTDGDGILDKDGKRFEFDFKVPSGRQFYIRVGSALQDACKQVGIRVQTAPLEWATFIDDYYQRRFDAVCLYSSWSDPWPDNYEEFHSSQDMPQGGNSAGWHHAEADELLAAMRREFDPLKRQEMFHRFNRIFHEEQPYTLLIHGKVTVLFHKRFQNARVTMLNGLGPVDFWVKPEDRLYR